jgi:hypothetical protein
LLRIDTGNIRAFTRGGHDWSEFWLKTKNVVESELILLGTDMTTRASRMPISAERQRVSCVSLASRSRA